MSYFIIIIILLLLTGHCTNDAPIEGEPLYHINNQGTHAPLLTKVWKYLYIYTPPKRERDIEREVTV